MPVKGKNKALSTLLVFYFLLSLLFFGFLFLLVSIGYPNDNLELATAFFLILVIGALALVIWKRSRGKIKARRKTPRKRIWDLTFDGRQPKTPVATYGLIAALSLIFCLELCAAFDWSPGILAPGLRSLVALGGSHLYWTVSMGGWYRAFTSVLLHGSLLHLLMNLLSLYLMGKILEHLIGPGWFLGIFFISGLSGAFFSMGVNPPEVIGVGASGAIMGLIGAGCPIAFQLKKDKDSSRLKSYLFQMLIFNVVPLHASHGGTRIDYGAHFGGALMGLVLGCLLAVLWGSPKNAYRWEGLGKVLAFGGSAIYLIAVGCAVVGYFHLRQTLGVPSSP